MSARQRIENLTTKWIGFVIVTGIATLLLNGLGIISLLVTLCSMAFNVLLVVWLGRKLAAGSRLTRTFLLVVATLGGVLGALGTATLGWQLLHGFTFHMLVMTVLVGANAAMDFHSLRVLLHRSVKLHCS